MQRPDLCKGCERHCCTRPNLTTNEYIRMYAVVGNDGIMKHGPRWDDHAQAWMFACGCPASSPSGCLISYEQRPLMCRLYPWVVIPCYHDDVKDMEPQLFLDAKRCPNWKAFGDNYDTAKQEFENG